MQVILYGEPMGKQRPRVTRHHTYTPAKTVNFETALKLQYMNTNKHKPVDGAVRMEIYAYFKIPKSISNKKRLLMIAHKIRPTKKPDFDNIAKIVGDALNGIAYLDDKQIVDGKITKWYSDQPRIEVYLEKV